MRDNHEISVDCYLPRSWLASRQRGNIGGSLPHRKEGREYGTQQGVLRQLSG